MNMKKKKALIISYNGQNNSGVPNIIFQVVSSFSDEYDYDIATFRYDNCILNEIIENGIFLKLIRSKAETSGAIYHLFHIPN